MFACLLLNLIKILENYEIFYLLLNNFTFINFKQYYRIILNKFVFQHHKPSVSTNVILANHQVKSELF